MNIWLYIGIALLLWVAYDLFAGVTWSYREIRRQHEPILYWIFTGLWLLIAIGTLYTANF